MRAKPAMPSYMLRNHMNKASLPQIAMQRIALHLITDFRPWAAPPGAHVGFLPFLASMISSSRSRWETHPDVEHYEKQWRPVISWLIGSAFCREAIDTLGWSAAIPVSVLEPSHKRGGPWPAYLATALKIARVEVHRKCTGLMPDYLAVPSGNGPFAFFESKGGKFPTIGRNLPGVKLAELIRMWTKQVCNAELVVHGQTHAAERWIAATRVHPGSRSRATYVRLWKVGCLKNDRREGDVDEPQNERPEGVDSAPLDEGTEGGAVVPPNEASDGEVDVRLDEFLSETESTAQLGGRSVATFAALARSITLHQLGLDATAESIATAASRLGAEVEAPQNPKAYDRAMAELEKCARVSSTDRPVIRIGTYSFGRKGPRLHLGLLASGLEEIELLARAAVGPRDEIAATWLDRPRSSIILEPIVEGAVGASRADGFVAWVEPS